MRSRRAFDRHKVALLSATFFAIVLFGAILERVAYDGEVLVGVRIAGIDASGMSEAQLRAALKGRLFGIDYEPLLRAIGHVLFVSKMADELYSYR